MDIKPLKSKLRIIFPGECENFMAEEALAALQNTDLTSKTAAEIDLSAVRTMDTTFVNILISLLNTLKEKGIKYEITGKSSEASRVTGLYGLGI
ncbi:STAS domain-containing protein [Geovibrio thiophilus]|uniref:STAS domain-containing protein n=1 Tax=Geovibrio thiophilus TaxID=139438 RepID=A0A3R5V264_9BACT|nr:STAS domain-containing protein [Geovibrio thiophilus]QAR33762.1 STAS domain-containing protein [Geovibrio thiophilus]